MRAGIAASGSVSTMDSQEPSIEEKLVPFVEGALAESDRREVLQALPQQPGLNQEVRQLREAIVTLRQHAAQGLTYHSAVEVSEDELLDYVLQGDSMTRSARSRFQLHMLESPELAEEVEILRELEQDLEQRLDTVPAVPPMSAALKTMIRETYAAPPPEPAWKLRAAAVVAWFSGMNLKVASAAVAGLVVVVAGAGIGRLANSRLQSRSTTTVAVSTTSTPALAAASSPAATEASQAPPGMVALSPDKIHPEDLPRLSRQLWQKQVSHSYRDGQIFVAAADVDRAWAALNLNEEKMAAAQPLKTGPAPAGDEKDKGLIGVLPPQAATSGGAAPAVARDVFAQPEAPAPLPAAPRKAARREEAHPAATAAPQVAVSLPPPPEHTQAYEAPPPPPPAQAPAASKAPAAPKSPLHVGGHSYRPPVSSSAPRPAAPVVADQVRPTQLARPETARPPKHEGNLNKKQAQAQPAPAPEPLSRPQVQKSAQVAQAASGAAGPAASPESGLDAQRQEPAPVPVTVAVEQVPLGDAKEDESLSNRMRNAPETRTNGMRPVPKLRAGDSSQGEAFRAAPAAGAADGKVANQSAVQGMAMSRDSENFEVPASAPFEVAMLPVAKKLVQDMVGEAIVKMERRDDGTLLVTIRPARTLTSEEVDKLRKLLRQKLELKDDDVVVIRQP